MLRQYGRRGTIVAVAVIFITLCALLNVYQPFGIPHEQELRTPAVRIEQTDQFEESASGSDGEKPAEAVIEDAKAALEDDAAKSEKEKDAEAAVEADATAIGPAVEPTFPSRQFPTADPSAPGKVIVMGKTQQEETNWVHELSDWSSAVYCVDLDDTETCPTGLKTPVNKAKEALPYLTYIVDHYANLPDIMAFVHAHRNGMPAAWHNDAPQHDAVRMLQQLRTDTVLDRGYVNLRCITELGCPDEVQPFRQPPAEDKHAEHAFPYFYAHFFNATYEEMRANISTVATPCCAQFAVSKDEVLKRNLVFYERVRDFLVETRYDDDTSGRVMEYMWHLIFGREAVHCEELFDCWCAVFGRCGLRKHSGWFGGGRWG